MQIPDYLWIYTANLSQLTEVYDIVRLDVVGQSWAKLLNRHLRSEEHTSELQSH